MCGRVVQQFEPSVLKFTNCFTLLNMQTPKPEIIFFLNVNFLIVLTVFPFLA